MAESKTVSATCSEFASFTAQVRPDGKRFKADIPPDGSVGVFATTSATGATETEAISNAASWWCSFAHCERGCARKR